MRKQLRNILMVTLLVWGLASSCISEDHSNCFNRYVLDLSYLGDGDTEIFNTKIGKVLMYIFDVEGKCVASKNLTNEDVQYRRVQLPPLQTGKYKIVCIGNPYSTSVKMQGDSLSSAVFVDNEYLSGNPVTTNDSLYFSTVDYAVESYLDTRGETRIQTQFYSSHYKVQVQIKGVPPDDLTHACPLIYITGLHSNTDFNNQSGGELTDYLLESVHQGGSTLYARCCILRHQDCSGLHLKIVGRDGQEWISVNFKEFIDKHGIDCSKQEVLIPFLIECKSADVEVTIPSWGDEEVSPDFGNQGL